MISCTMCSMILSINRVETPSSSSDTVGSYVIWISIIAGTALAIMIIVLLMILRRKKSNKIQIENTMVNNMNDMSPVKGLEVVSSTPASNDAFGDGNGDARAEGMEMVQVKTQKSSVETIVCYDDPGSSPQTSGGVLSCGFSKENIKLCPSAQTIKLLLQQLHQHGDDVHSQSDGIQSLMEENDYSVTKLFDAIHHLKYDHGIDRNDALFDAAYDYFKDSSPELGCDMEKCPFFQRHHRDRGAVDDEHKDDDLLMDTMSMMHCYLLHSYDTQRFSKEERQNIMKEAGFILWEQVIDALDDDALDDDGTDEQSTKLMNKVTGILSEKVQKSRGRRRFHDPENTEEGHAIEVVDFAMLSAAVGVDESMLRQSLGEYKENRQSLISHLIDVVYGEDEEKMEIWNKLEFEEEEKRRIFRSALFDHFHCFQLNVDNLKSVCLYIIERKRLEIDSEHLAELLRGKAINGRVFDKAHPHHQKNGIFAKQFKGVPNCKLQHVRQLYSAVKKWKYVEVKKVVEETKEEDEVTENEPEQQPGVVQDAVYAIGKPYNFWQQQFPDYVQPKYGNLKEEMLHNLKQEMLENAMLFHCMDIRIWNNIMGSVSALVKTSAARKIKSNGRTLYKYGIQEGKPFDTIHLCALKLYTDITVLCGIFCAILRRGDIGEVAGIANMSRILCETVQCFGTVTNMDKKYYRGVNRTFMFRTIVSLFNLPQSTTNNVKNIRSLQSLHIPFEHFAFFLLRK